MAQPSGWKEKCVTIIAAYDTTILTAQFDVMHPAPIGNPIPDGNEYLTSSP